ncbi:MAG TPA: hypothetical protein VJ203_13860 [Bacteroidales bacterium]|nr:hypothetical protein [Bacteroidales bacterium]
MKYLYSLLLSGMFFLTGLSAQSGEDSTGYNPGIRMFEKAVSTDDYIQAALYFEQLAEQYPGHWLVMYYAGLCYIQASYKAQGDKLKDEIMDKVQPLIDKAFRLKPGEPEIHVLQAFLYQSRMQVNPEFRGMSYSQKADASLKKVAAADPNNPRAYSLMGYNIYYTPAIFGGGAKNALPLFLKAREKFLAFVPELPFMPVWGGRENQEMINACYKTAK